MPERRLGGCDFPVHPDLKATQANLYWKPSIAPAVTALFAKIASDKIENCDIGNVVLHTRRGAEGRYWICLRTGLVVVSDDPLVADSPSGIVIPLDDDWSIRIDTAHRLRALACGESAPALFTDQRRDRIGRALRAGDAKQTGAHLRDIAITYFGGHRVASEPWKTSALKAQVARLASYGRKLTDDGYKQLLRGRTAQHPCD